MKRALAASGTLVLFFSAAFYAAGCGDDDAIVEGVDAGPDGTAADGSPGIDSSTGDTGTTDTGTKDTGTTDTGVADAGPDVVLIADSGGGVIDAGGGGDGAVLNCGNAQCNLPNETCCFYPLLAPPPPFYGACSNGNSCPALTLDAGVGDAGPATELQCTVQANCPANNVCCISGPVVGSPGKISAHCLNAGACTTQVTPILLDAGNDATTDGGVNVQPRAVLCDLAAADAGCSVDAGACSSANIGTWNVPNGFATCGGRTR